MFFARRSIVATAVLLALGAVPAVYAQVSFNFNLPAQPLGDALRAVGSQGGVNVTFEPATVRGRNAPALKGSYSVRQALDHLLAGSGLVLRTTQGGSYLVEMPNGTNSIHLSTPQPVSFDFDIQSQNLRATLYAIMRTTGQKIDFDPAVISKKKASAVNGRLTLAEVLSRVLAGTGLHASVASSGGAEVLPGPQSAQQLPTVIVTATIHSLSATRVPTALKEIPQSVSVISQETLQQQNAAGLADALTHATGITVQQNTSLDSTFLSRGFYISEVHIDGSGPIALPNSFQTGLSSPIDDLSEYDHIEVLRGADALFGGSGNPGATISLERKQPQADPEASITAKIGSHEYYREVLDATGPLGLNGALRGRFVASNTNQNYFYPGSRRQHKVYGILQYDLTPATMLTIGGSIEQVNAIPTINGLPFYDDGSDPHLPRSTALIFPMNHSSTHNNEVFVKLDQKFGDNWKLKVEASSLDQKGNSTLGGYGSSINPVTKLISGFSTSAANASNLSNTASATLTGGFDLWGKHQEVAMGIDYSRQNVSTLLRQWTLVAPPLDPWSYDPNAYTTVAPPSIFTPAVSSMVYNNTKQIGGYAALRLHFLNDWQAVIGARDNYYRASSGSETSIDIGPPYGSYSYPGLNTNLVSTGVVAPYAALVYDMGKHYSIYASYTDIYEPNFGELNHSGSLIPAVRGNNMELGLKSAWYDGLLNGSFALFSIKQRNLAVQDPNTPINVVGNATCCYLSAINSSKGVDTELSGRLTPNWQVDIGYTFNLNQQYANLDRVLGTGRQLLSTVTPKHMLKIWTDYRLPGKASQWSLGGGLIAQTSNYIIGSVCNQFDPLGNCIGDYEDFNIRQGFYTVVTLRASYRISDHWSAALNIDNLFDRRYYETLFEPYGGNWYGSPRSFMLTIKAEL